jgi:hypothetical protein
MAVSVLDVASRTFSVWSFTTGMAADQSNERTLRFDPEANTSIFVTLAIQTILN